MLKPSSQSISLVKNLQETKRLDDLYRFLWVRCKAHDESILDSYEKFVTTASKHLGVEYVKTETPFRIIYRRSLLASRFVHKKVRQQYEVRNYMRDMQFKNLTSSTADTFLEYIERNVPEGVLLKIEKHKLVDLPFELENNKE